MNLYDVGLFFTHRGRIQDSLVLVVGFITHGRHERGTTIALLSSTIVAGIQALVLGSGSTTKSSGRRNICSCFSFFQSCKDPMFLGQPVPVLAGPSAHHCQISKKGQSQGK